jgi:hypothetical protein
MEQVCSAVTLQACIKGVHGSNIGQDTYCPDLWWFSRVPPGKCRDSNYHTTMVSFQILSSSSVILLLASSPYFEKIEQAYEFTLMCVPISLSLLGNGRIKIPLSLLGNGMVKIPLSLLGNGSVETLPL